MAQLIDIRKVTIGPRYLDAEVELAEGAPLRTSEDPAATGRVMRLLPELQGHLCLGDSSKKFGQVARDTEVAHLLEHVTVELVARTGLGGRVSSGRTRQTGERSFELRFECPDDVLVTAALSSAAWVLEWAFGGGEGPTPDVDAVVRGIRGLVESAGSAPEGAQEQAGEDAPGSAAPEAGEDAPGGATGATPSDGAPSGERDTEDDDWTFETLDEEGDD